MRTISILIFSLVFNSLFAQEIVEQEVKSEVKEAIVFLDGAQVFRNKNINLTKGKSIIKFTMLSPFIEAKSIQLKTKGELTVLSVNHQLNYLNKSEKSKEIKLLESKLDVIRSKVTLENTHISVINEELEFLRDNRDIGGKNQQLTLTNLQQTADYYSKKLTSLKLKEIERKNTLRELYKQQSDIQNQIRNISTQKVYPTGEVWVKVDAKQAKAYPMDLSYMVINAGWFPTYDIRANNINEPIQLIYKANVKQNTRVNWTNVKLTFSSADPNTSGVAPKLQTYYLDYNTLPPVYNMESGEVTGRVTASSDGLGLPFVNVIVKGTSIGTVTDSNGKYSITIPNNASHLEYSFIGMKNKCLPIYGSNMNVSLEEELLALNEVVVTGYAEMDDELEIEDFDENIALRLQGRAAGVSISSDKKFLKKREKSLAIPVDQVENKTSVNFEIKTPYSIKSGNANFSIDMANYELPALYQYYCIPKINKNAFLLANIPNWEKYNLLDGEANVFFEDTYIGKSLLDLRFASDTLQISLGIDKKVSVKREKIKDYSVKRSLGKNKEETLAWKTTVKNNKNQEIKMMLIDQVPVSARNEIEVNILNQSGAKYNSERGEIKWEFQLQPSLKKELELKYTVKYPKLRQLVIE